MWNRVTGALLALSVLGLGCAVDAEDGDSSSTEEGEGGAGGAGEPCPDCGGAGGAAPSGPTFDEVFEVAFVTTGCVYGCHDETARGGLTLSPTESAAPDANLAYAALVGVVSSSESCGGQPLVVPGVPEQSLVWLKMAAELGVPGIEVCGAPMPKGTDQISQADLDLVEQWILAGAPR